MAGVCKRLINISIGWQDDEFLFADIILMAAKTEAKESSVSPLT